MRRLIVLLVTVAAVCAGCTTFDVGRYGVSVENNAALKKLSGPKVTVGAFTAIEPGKNEIPCRAVGPIKTPDRRRASWWSSRRAATGNSPRWVDSLPEESYAIHACAPADAARARSRGRARASRLEQLRLQQGPDPHYWNRSK